MDTSISQRMRADPGVVFALAATVEDWPSILPHYRWVRVLAGAGQSKRLVEMAARRDVVEGWGFPLRWTAIEIAQPDARRVEFEHVRGITRGMRVTWTIEHAHEPPDDELLVRIRHVFNPAWAVPRSLVQQVVGEYFVNGVARRTLRHIARVAEGRQLQHSDKDA